MESKREWIEFGKIYNKLVNAGIEFEIHHIPDNETDNVYQKLKKFYYDEIHGESKEVELELPLNIFELISEESDKENLLIDEYISNILEEYIQNKESSKDELPKSDYNLNKCLSSIDKYQPAECCFHCVNGLSAKDYDTKMECNLFPDRKIHRSFVCNNFCK